MVEAAFLQQLLPLITGAVGGATSAGVFTGPIQTIQDLWYIYYGHKVSDKADLMRKKHEVDVENFKHELLVNISKTPPENVQDPKLKILGPALEASNFYIEEEELRQMFAKVIASSINKDRNALIHSSFVDIIKQIDVLDANILKYIKSLCVAPNHPIPTLQQVTNIGDEELINYPIIFFTEDLIEVYKNSASLINLKRLGLIDINYSIQTLNDIDYKYLESHLILDILKKNPNTTFKRTSICLTTYGHNFLMCCV